MKEFSDIPQPDLPKNETTDILIFNIPENIPLKIILPQSEKNTPSSSTNKDKQDGRIQTLFNYMAEDICALVASSFKTAEISKVVDPTSSRPMVKKSARQ